MSSLEEVILSVCSDKWQKVAKIICDCKDIIGDEYSYNEIGDAVKEMTENKLLELVGDVTNWRYSEVKLP